MSLDTNIINSAANKKYTEFSDAIKAELRAKFAEHPVSKKYASDYDSIHTMKQMFAEINAHAEE